MSRDLRDTVSDIAKEMAGILLELLWVLGDIVELGADLFRSFFC